MLAIAGQTTEPNWLIFLREPTGHGYPGPVITLDLFFSKLEFYVN